MKEKVLKTTVQVMSWDELSTDEQELMEVAKTQTQKSYSPYSHFQVGAAVRLEDGRIIVGTNQENAAYPSGLCAERAALFAAGSMFPELPVRVLAIACYTNGHFTAEPGSPCGSCRQVMVETEHRYPGKMKVMLYGEKHIFVFQSAQDLMPLSFVSEDLEG